MVERIFGIFKKMWRILVYPPEFSLEIQARIPPGLAAVHNFILEHDPSDIASQMGPVDDMPGTQHEGAQFGTLSNGPLSTREKARAKQWRDGISQRMWDDYQALHLNSRGVE